jgi:DNA-binding SARP family transcriptional activator
MLTQRRAVRRAVPEGNGMTAQIERPERRAGPAVIQGKLAIPPLVERRVERPRLDRSLAALIERHRVVVVSATAGAGKTTAVAAALRRVDRPVAWLTLDRTDAAPGRLLTYVEAALAGQLPHLGNVASRALAAGIAHTEAAGLVAEAVGDAPVVLVLDELERLGDGSRSWDVVEAFVRHAPPQGMRFVLISRRAIPVALDPLAPGEGMVAALGEAELAFTASEAGDALAGLGEAEIDAQQAVEATGGWVTGVLFEAWRAAGHVAGVGGEADPLHGYLASHILGKLDRADRDFLVATSLLRLVNVARAEALGYSDAAQRLASLRAARLPVSWDPDGRALRCHSRLREFLLECLERRGADEMRRLRLAHGRLLAREGDDEEATEELLRAGAPAEALVTAERVILSLIGRLDLPVAKRWLDALRDVAPSGASLFTTAELMVAIGEQDFRRGARIVDQLAATGDRERLATTGPAGALMALCYAVRGRFDEAHALLDLAAPDPAAAAMRYVMSNAEPGPPPPRPELSGGPLDAIIFAGDYFHGRLSQLAGERSGWSDAISGASRIGALRVTGRTQQALELYEAVRARRTVPSGLDETVGPEVLIDAGRREEAREAIARGRSEARKSGHVMFLMYSAMLEAKLALRLERDPRAARAALDAVERERAAHPYPVVFEPLDTWYGLALLLESDDGAALARLRRAVDSMVVGDRILELPTAAVYLAEAEWRAGNEQAADRAADLAFDTARRLGSNHLLLQALADFPAVVSRRIDAEPDTDSPWHELGRALLAQGVAVDARVHASVHLLEFGRAAIVVNGEEVRPRIAKAYELLAYLVTRAPRRAEREDLLDALFDGRSDESTRAYLRQAVRWLRHVLPDPAALVVERGTVRLRDDVVIMSESNRFEAALAEAARLQGHERLSATLDALAIYDKGDYLPSARSGWADDRRQRLAELATDARSEAAELALAAERYDEAERLAEEVLHTEPWRETAWRLTMRISHALGDDAGVIRAYHACGRALSEVGTKPSRSTDQLLERLRR